MRVVYHLARGMGVKDTTDLVGETGGGGGRKEHEWESG